MKLNRRTFLAGSAALTTLLFATSIWLLRRA